MSKTLAKMAALANTALKMCSQCSFTVRVNFVSFIAELARRIFASIHYTRVLHTLRSLHFGKGFKFICNSALVVLALLPLTTHAEEISDPMRPAYITVGSAASHTEPRWSVTGVLISPERRLAMINDRLIGIGEKVDGARVKSIYSNGVELEIDGRSVFLKSLTSSLRRAN